MKFFSAVILLLAVSGLAGCLAESAVMLDDTKMPVISGLQKVQIQDPSGQPLVGATVQMAMSAGDVEPVDTVGIANGRGRLDMPRSTSATYYFSMPGYTTLTATGHALFGKTPTPAPNYQMQGTVLVVTLQPASPAADAQLFNGQQMWQQGVVEPIKKMPIIPVGQTAGK